MMKSIKEFSYSLIDIDKIAAEFYEIAQHYKVWAFSGQLGAGKTTFTAAVCRLLKVQDGVSSPTFAIINEYHRNTGDFPKVIYHADWYRMADEEEAINAGVEEIFNDLEGLIIVEWWERAENLLPKDTLFVYFTVEEADKRRMELKV